jgi:hypothetical protein
MAFCFKPGASHHHKDDVGCNQGDQIGSIGLLFPWAVIFENPLILGTLGMYLVYVLIVANT